MSDVEPFEEPDPWEQLVGESQRAYAAFCSYRDLGPARSFRAAYATTPEGKKPQKATKSHSKGSSGLPGSWKGWSSTFRWAERVKAYDTHLERQDRARREAERAAKVELLRERTAARAQRLQDASDKILDALLARLELPLRIDAAQLPSLLRAAADVAGKGLNLELDALGLRDYLEGKEIADDGREEEDDEALEEWEDRLAEEERAVGSPRFGERSLRPS